MLFRSIVKSSLCLTDKIQKKVKKEMTKTRKIVTVTASVLFPVMIAAGGYILFGGQVKPSFDAAYNATVNFNLIYN